MGNGQTTRLRPEAMGELAESTDFTEDEIRKWYKDFLRDFPDGQLSIDQFKDIYIQHFPNGDATKFAEHVFRTFDTDQDRNLDFREFMCALSITARGGPKDRLKWAFQMYDVDENGYITKKECVEIVRAMYRLLGSRLSVNDLEMTPEQRTDRLFDMMDLNKDDKITVEEFYLGAHTDPALVTLLHTSIPDLVEKE